MLRFLAGVRTPFPGVFFRGRRFAAVFPAAPTRPGAFSDNGFSAVAGTASARSQSRNGYLMYNRGGERGRIVRNCVSCGTSASGPSPACGSGRATAGSSPPVHGFRPSCGTDAARRAAGCGSGRTEAAYIPRLSARPPRGHTFAAASERPERLLSDLSGRPAVLRPPFAMGRNTYK